MRAKEVATVSWTTGRGKLVRTFGWLVPTLSTILTPCAFTQDNGTVLASTRVSRQIIVSIPDRKLVVMQNGAVLREFPIAVGANASPSPTGTFEIVNRLSDPTYYHAGIVLPPGADNPLGPRWVGLNKKGYGIHGTNAPGSIGKAASHGCIRLRNRDMVQFFALVHVGDTVEIHGARDEEIAAIFGTDTNALVDIPATGGTAGGQ
jgi:lipoprotein-anchoring transpeptidase ErfK/SrfK